MADEPTTTTTVVTPEPERTVPYDRFKAVNDKLAEATRKAEEAAQKAQELEDRDKTELEQVRSKLEKAEARNAELEGEVGNLSGKLTRNERSGWVRDAASKANFIDPADALGRVNLDEVETEAEAQKAVKTIADNAKHLLASDKPDPPQVGQVIRAGQPVSTNGEKDPQVEENERFLTELKEASSKGWSSSSTGLIDQ